VYPTADDLADSINEIVAILSAPELERRLRCIWFDTITLMRIPFLAVLAATASLAQAPQYRALLEAEQAREAGLPTLLAALKASDPHAQQLAARAIGRLENPARRDMLEPLTHSAEAQTRIAAVAALAQMRAPFAYGSLLGSERVDAVRAIIYEAIGRATPGAEDAESLLVAGLSDPDPQARAGAARGLNSLFWFSGKPPHQPAAATTAALHAAFAANPSEAMRIPILSTMITLADRDPGTFSSAAADPSPQVRRLAVIGAGTWTADPSPMVRYEALRVAPTCDRAAAALGDVNEHVALAAVDELGSLKCDAALLVPLLRSERSWRIRAHAVVSMAAVDSAQARTAISAMMANKTWQVRAYAAKAARLLNDSAMLATLARDANPNVAIAALTTLEDAMRALRSDHSGLILAGAKRLKTAPDLQSRLPQLIAAFKSQTAKGAMTVRDERIELLTRIGEANDASTDTLMRRALGDRDPAIARLAAQILGRRTGTEVSAQTTKLPVPTLPPAAYIQGLSGAIARITMHGGGTITVNLQTDDAPVTVGVFAQLAEAGKYNGLTFHRIVPNFVIQGGSPGADEFDALSREFMRDEVGLTRNARGTIGISTRGRDTGDGQIYFNLVDNSSNLSKHVGLDHDYTVFATMLDGMEVMDRVQEGDVMERVEIIRHRRDGIRGAYR
jgi:cyclophilin family peptidyl-prolyl cis-trans isomerase